MSLASLLCRIRTARYRGWFCLYRSRRTAKRKRLSDSGM